MATIEQLLASTISTLLSQQQVQANTEANKPTLKKFEDLKDDEVQQGIKDVLQSSTYSGSSRDSFMLALYDSISGKMTLTNAAAKYGIPFSTIHPYMKKLQIKLGIYDSNTKKPKMSNKRKHDETEDGSLTPNKNQRNYSSLPEYVPFKQISIPDYWLQFPEKMKACVWETVSNCSYDDNEKKQRLLEGILDVMIRKKTLKAAGIDNSIPFTTLQSYFHRSRIVLEQRMNDDEEVQRAKPPSQTTESASDDSPPALDCFAAQPLANAFGFIDPAIAMFTTLPPEQQNYFAQLMVCANSQANTFGPPPNLSNTNFPTDHGVYAMMNWVNSQSLPQANVNLEIQTPTPSRLDNFDESPSSTTSPHSDKSLLNGSNILDELAAMKPIKLNASVNIINDQTNITISEDSNEQMIGAADIHDHTVIFDHEKFANNFIPYYVYHCKDISPNNYGMAIGALKTVIIDKKSANQHGLSNFDKHVSSIQTLMKYIVLSFPVLLYRIKPAQSNYANFDDFISGKVLYHHNRLLSPPPDSLMKLIKDCDFQLLIKYVKPFLAANMEIDLDFTTFLINQFIKDRSFPELYNENEFKIIHECFL